MAIAKRAAFGATGSGVTKVTTTIASPAAAGDYGFAVVEGNAAGLTVTPPTGWTQIGSSVGTQSATYAVFGKVLTSGDIGAAQDWTFSASNKPVVALVVLSGVDTTGPVVAGITPVTYPSTTRTTWPSPAADYSAEGVAIEWAATRGTDPGAFAIPGTHTELAQQAAASAGAPTVGIFMSTADLDGAVPFTLANGSAWPQGAAGGVRLKAAATTPPPTPGTVNSVWTGHPTAAGFTCVHRTTGATSVRLAISASPTMSAPTYTAAVTPDSFGFCRWTVTGLAPNTAYYVQAEDTPAGGSGTLVGEVGTIRTLQTAGVPFTGTRKVFLASCIKTGGSASEPAIDDAIAWAPDYGCFLGDLFYNGDSSTTEAAWIGKYNSQIAAVPGLRTMTRSGLLAWDAVSDHDTMAGDNGDSNGAQAPFEQAAWRRIVPWSSLGSSTVRDRSWQDGRVGFYLMDVRSPERSPGADPDTSSKTMLGSGQLARVLDWIANSPAPFKVLLSDVGWDNPASTTNGPDKWWSYATERQTIINAINAAKANPSSATLHVEVWHGDSHLVGYKAPGDNASGGFPVLCAAPMDETGGGRNANLFTAYFNNGSTATHNYGRITFTDDGSKIIRTFVGWGEGAERMTFATTVSTAAAANTSGTGTLTAGGTPLASASATTSGSGTVTASAAPALPGVAATSGTGSLVAGGSPATPGVASTSGAGSLTIGARPAAAGAASTSGAGTLAAAGSAAEAGAGSATTSGAGNVTVGARAAASTTASTSGTGTLAATSRPGGAGLATTSGAGTVTAAALPRLAGLAETAGLGTLAAVGASSGASRDITVLAIIELVRPVVITEALRAVTIAEVP